MWTMYGIAIKDATISFVNVIGVMLQCSYLVCHFVYSKVFYFYMIIDIHAYIIQNMVYFGTYPEGKVIIYRRLVIGSKEGSYWK